MNLAIAILLAYLLGSLSFAVLVSRAFGLGDPRSYGSRNPGATNVLRSGNKLAALVTLLLDGAKGWLAVFLALRLGSAWGIDELGVALVAIAVFLGHLFPVFFAFKGGKGVATAFGVMLGLQLLVGVYALLTWLVVALVFRYSSLAALTAMLLAPLYYVLMVGLDSSACCLILICALIFVRHHQNIRKLVKGTEGKIGQKKDASGKPEQKSA